MSKKVAPIYTRKMPNERTLTIKELMKAHTYRGWGKRTWSPHMRVFIVPCLSTKHMLRINPHRTACGAVYIYQFLKRMSVRRRPILFVCTKPWLTPLLQETAQKCGASYVTNKWVGGLISNWSTTSSRLSYLTRLEKMKAAGGLTHLSKKIRAKLDRKYKKMLQELGGMRALTGAPDVLFVVDPKQEKYAVAEARRIMAPSVGLVDTNGNPWSLDMPVPANASETKSVSFLLDYFAEAILEGGKLERTDPRYGKLPCPDMFTLFPTPAN